MKSLSSLILLGAAAGVALASSAQAADLPMKVKAPAVQYVKICSLYGAGYYYIPGTDTCLKIGGYMRIDMVLGSTGGGFASYNFNTNWNGGASYFSTRARAYASFDARTQTEYGTLRSYFRTGAQVTNAGSTGAYSNRIFIQLAGFTWGLTSSIFDQYDSSAHVHIVTSTNGAVGYKGTWQWRYTAQLGGGMYAAVAMEDPLGRRTVITGPVAGWGYAGTRWPDFVASIGTHQPWGRIGAGVAVHDVSAWNGATKVNGVGWAASIGGLVKVPGMPGDTFGFQFAYAKGASGFITQNINTAANGQFITIKGGVTSWGWVNDATVVAGGTSLDKTTAYQFEVGYKHAWTRTLSTALEGGLAHFSYSTAAATVLCGAGCNPDTSVWEIASSTRWSPVSHLTLSADVMYTGINSGTGLFANEGNSSGIWTGLVRVQHVFYQ